MRDGGEKFTDFQVIATGSGFKHKESGNLGVTVNRSFIFQGRTWDYRANPLASPNSLHTAVGRLDDQGNPQFDSWLDWHNMGDNPETARSLVFTGIDPDVSLEEKLQRVNGLSLSIQAYDTLMVPYNPKSSRRDLIDLLSGGQLPKPQLVQLVWSNADGGLGLNFVVERLKIKSVGDEFQISWNHLLELCQSEVLVRTWEEMTSTTLGRKMMFVTPEEDPNRPETFYKDELLLAVTGHTVNELLGIVNQGYITPVDRTSSFGRDTPRSDSEKFMDQFEIFMGIDIMASLLGIPIDIIYKAAERFRRFEKYIHPQTSNSLYRKYFDPSYKKIEDAYRKGDGVAVRTAVQGLIDKILHD